jgi:hypothetical protein
MRPARKVPPWPYEAVEAGAPDVHGSQPTVVAVPSQTAERGELLSRYHDPGCDRWCRPLVAYLYALGAG